MGKTYLVVDVLKKLNLKKNSGSFYNILRNLEIPIRYEMRKDSNDRIRKFRSFTSDEVKSMVKHKQSLVQTPLGKPVCPSDVVKLLQKKVSEIKIILGLKK